MANSLLQYWLIGFISLLAYPAITDCANLRFYNRSLDNFTEISLDDPVTLLNSPNYQSEYKTVIFTFGYTENTDSPSSKGVVGAYLDSDVNMLLLNWEEESDAGVFGLSYGLNAIPKSDKVGKQFGEALKKLYAAGLDLKKVHLIGFSLGAQLMASAAEVLKKSNFTVARITGLDPAGPLFDGLLQAPFPKLKPTSADFVDVIHGNPGGFGTIDSVGTVDFWPNCESSIQPSCVDNVIDTLTLSEICSHLSSWKYYIEALKNSTAFAARSATSCSSWMSGDGTDEVIYMGNDVDTQARGDFYFRTSTTSTNGLYEEGTQPASS